jgi:Fe-S oxidoreductase
VKEALDLCLACKGCKGECPVSVDMATYKSEFLSHYYEQHRRPITAYAFGLIHWWARLASLMPRTVNVITHAPGLRNLAKLAVGMPQARDVPAFAPQTFQDWFRRRPRPHTEDRPHVILWPDTFNNHFHPETAIAAVHVLERAGFHVEVPQRPLCCGRPLYDYGMLTLAKVWLREVLQALGPQIKAGIPMVGLEPSCVAVFRDEMKGMLPADEDAKRLSRQTFTLSELLEQKARGFTYPTLHRKAIVHGHCHHKSIMKMADDSKVLDAVGLDYEILDSGCCGMAGSFGFERDHYDVSLKVGELVLLPAVRDAAKDTVIVADGFSCREQIAQTTDRRAVHLAELLQMAMTYGPAGPAGDCPERTCVADYAKDARTASRVICAGLAVAAVGLLWMVARRALSRERGRDEG